MRAGMPFGVLAGLLFGHILGEDLAGPQPGHAPRRPGADGRDATSLMKEYGGGYWKRRREAEQERLSKSASKPSTASETLEEAIEIPGDGERGASSPHSRNSSNGSAPPSSTSSTTETPANPSARPKSTRRRSLRANHSTPIENSTNQPSAPSSSDSSSRSTSNSSSTASSTTPFASSTTQTATEDASTEIGLLSPSASQSDPIAPTNAPAQEAAPIGFRRSKRTAATRGAAFITSLSPNSSPWASPTPTPTSSNAQTLRTPDRSVQTPSVEEEGDKRRLSQNAKETSSSRPNQTPTHSSATEIAEGGRSEKNGTEQDGEAEASNADFSPQLPSSSSSNSVLKDFKCVVCLDNVVDPTATFCGHVFCEACIIASIEANHRCPTCRCKLSLQEIHPLFI